MNDFGFLNYQMYKDTKVLRKSLEPLCDKLSSNRSYVLLDQLNRASLSIMLNIAEGSAKYTKKEFRRFLNISLGSLFEVVSCIDACHDANLIDSFELKIFLDQSSNIGRQISGLIRKLKS